MVRIEADDFSLKKIADSGQCFRLLPSAPGRWHLTALGRALELDELEHGAALHCSKEEYESLWRGYFDLETDYAAFRAAVPGSDRYLTCAAEYGRGIRILRQDPWEMLVTFLISQRRNIPAIRRSVELLCCACGKKLGDGTFAFPDAHRVNALSDEALAACSLGYRAPYVRAAARMASDGTLDAVSLAALSDEALSGALQTVPGVGPKVASCVMLFGYHRLAGFPRDVWINRVIEEQYGGCFPLERYRGFEGVIQQYLFYYGRSLGRGETMNS